MLTHKRDDEFVKGVLTAARVLPGYLCVRGVYVAGMKVAVGADNAMVLWYDSVTADTGELKWQDGRCPY